MEAVSDSEAQGPPPARISSKKLIRWIIFAALLIAAAVFAYRYWAYGRTHASTDNAYVQANTVTIAAQVGGPVAQLYVRENQPVAEGERLFDIDARPYRLELERAQAQVRLATQSVSEQEAAVHAAEAQLAQRRAELQNAQATRTRTQRLVRQGFLSEQGAEEASTNAATAAAALRAAEANLEQARSALGSGNAPNASVQAAEAALHQAELNLERTRVRAPASGVIANLSLRPGHVVQPGAPLFSLIGDQEFWVDANFKETELERVRPGQHATVTTDMYPGHPFRGVVESVSGGSGAAFSLLPPENATGNWVKVTQRVPVRIRIEDPDPDFPLRVGTTATVEIALDQDRKP